MRSTSQGLKSLQKRSFHKIPMRESPFRIGWPCITFAREHHEEIAGVSTSLFERRLIQDIAKPAATELHISNLIQKKINNAVFQVEQNCMLNSSLAGTKSIKQANRFALFETDTPGFHSAAWIGFKSQRI